MKLQRVLHTGLTVRDIEKSIAFYRDVLGLKLIYRAERDSSYSNDFIGRNIGIPGAHVKIAWLTLGAQIVELIEYVSPQGERVAKTRPNDVGNVHVAFQVDDLEEAYEYLKARGAKFAARPPYVAEGPTKGTGAIYLWDHDGINLEFVYRPPGLGDDTYRKLGTSLQR